MAELTVAASVTRTELQLGDLNIDDGTSFTLAQGLRIGSVTWRRETVQSPFVEGRIPVHEVKDAAESTVVVYVHGTSNAILNQNVGTLLDAFTKQYTYDLKLTVNSVNYQWVCERADYEVAFATAALNALLVPVSLSFHRKPTPFVGVF